MILKIAIFVSAFLLTSLLILGVVSIYFGFRGWFSGAWSGVSSWVSDVTASFSFSKWFASVLKTPTESTAPILTDTDRVSEGYGTRALREAKDNAVAAADEIAASKVRTEAAAARTAESERRWLQVAEENTTLKAQIDVERAKLADPDAHVLKVPEESAEARRVRIASLEETEALVADSGARSDRLDRLEKRVGNAEALLERELAEEAGLAREVGDVVKKINSIGASMTEASEEQASYQEEHARVLQAFGDELGARLEVLEQTAKVRGASPDPSSHQPLFSLPLESSCDDSSSQLVLSAVNNG